MIFTNSDINFIKRCLKIAIFILVFSIDVRLRPNSKKITNGCTSNSQKCGIDKNGLPY
jgi:hypothetical protein